MSPAHKHPYPLLEPGDSEGSAVYERGTPQPSAGRSDVGSGQKLHRLEVKVALAHALVRSLPSTHELRRLLAIAVIRRDEVIVDGILRQLSGERDTRREG